jgi:hypothetical protein
MWQATSPALKITPVMAASTIRAATITLRSLGRKVVLRLITSPR